MASNQAVAAAVANVFAAHHSSFSPTEAKVFARALVDVTDDELDAAVSRLVAGEKWDFGRRPSPALVLEWVGTERAARRAKTRPPPPPPPTPPQAVQEHMAAVRAARSAGIQERRRLEQQA